MGAGRMTKTMSLGLNFKEALGDVHEKGHGKKVTEHWERTWEELEHWGVKKNESESSTGMLVVTQS